MSASGAYSATGLAPGRWLVTSYVLGYRALRAPLELGSEPRVVRHDVALEPAVVLRVKATAPDGSPLRAALQRAGKSPFAYRLADAPRMTAAAR